VYVGEKRRQALQEIRLVCQAVGEQRRIADLRPLERPPSLTNLALGDRRANAVKEYLVSRGVTTDRLQTISYGEERPKYDNNREETRRLNRRAALVVRLQ